MEVIVDDIKGYPFQARTGALTDVLTEIVERLDEAGRGLQTVEVDGQPVSPEHIMELLSGRSVDETHTLHVRSEAIATLAEQSLRDMEEVLPELAVACHSLAEIAQNTPPEEWKESFEDLAGIWRVVKTRQRQIASALNVEFDTLSLEGGVSLNQHHQEVEQHLTAAGEAVESADKATLGDLLTYELAPRAEIECAINSLLLSSISEPPESR